MSKHMQRIAAPKKYPILKKISKYVIKTNPGPHPIKSSLPLLLVVRDMLGMAKTAQESRKLLNMNTVMVDKYTRKDPKFPVGLMDTISIQEMKKNFRIIFDKDGKVILTEINEDEAGLKICKIIDKKVIKKEKLQLNLHDGRNILVTEPKYKPGDTLLITLPKQEIKKHLPLDKGVSVYITDGKHIGEVAKVSEFRSMKGSNPDRVVLTTEKGESFETLKKYVFVVGQESPEIRLYGEKSGK